MIRHLALLSTLIFTFQLNAEPWLASRYANNCAACHSPGRVNVEPKQRRCTWTCQGCHTNPNGGGLRNTYGKWNQERWLRSTYVNSYRLNKPRPDVTEEQQYAPGKLKEFLAKNTDVRLLKRAQAEGFRLKETPRILPESAYATPPGDEETIEPDLEMARLRIPDEDPFRQRRKNLFNAGMDLRYLYLDSDTDRSATATSAASKTSKKATFPMATDIGVSMEPLRKITLAVEARFLDGTNRVGNPRQGWDEGFSSGAQVKSAYVLFDDLPFNAYIMHGLYRPQMGHSNPDHTTLFAYATGMNQKTYYKATTVGAAPRVPFFNFHYIQPVGDSSSADKKQDQGFALNVGGRWATRGIYTMLSYWHTTADNRPSGGNIVDNSYLSATAGATVWRWTGTFDYSIVERDQKEVRADKGTVLTVENRFRILREHYALLNYELLNTDTDLRDGSSRQLSLGVSSFWISSMELSLMYKNLTVESKNSGDFTTKMLLGQVHLFF